LFRHGQAAPLDRAEVLLSAVAMLFSNSAHRASSTSPPTASANASSDPLSRSGLAFSGANRKPLPNTDDAILTAAEATALQLNGTDIVVLSACQTGLGDVQSGEGVYGLQRALTVAGARSTLLSLWKVDDLGTALFMKTFYSNLLKGLSRADALAATQASFRNRDDGLRDEYIWAAFQLTGDWTPIAPH
jgi:CHAT domain-containing protein